MRGVKRDALTRSYTLENHTPPNGRRFKCLFGHNSFATSHGFTFSCASRLSTTPPPPPPTRHHDQRTTEGHLRREGRPRAGALLFSARTDPYGDTPDEALSRSKVSALRLSELMPSPPCRQRAAGGRTTC